MQNIVLVVHVITALAIIGFILIQQGKGAEAGASFGAGASQTMFGSAGSWNFFSRVTAILATVFFVTSFSLAVISKNNSKVGDRVLPAIEQYHSEVLEQQEDIPALEEVGSEIPAVESDIPVIPEESEIPE